MPPSDPIWPSAFAVGMRRKVVENRYDDVFPLFTVMQDHLGATPDTLHVVVIEEPHTWEDPTLTLKHRRTFAARARIYF